MSDIPTFEYEGVKRVSYGGWCFIPVCPKCGRFVKADETVMINEDHGPFPGWNATCKKCGRVEMPCEGYIGDEE